MAKIPVMPVGGESGGVVCGTYVGNTDSGDQYSREISLGFTPRAVLLFSVALNRLYNAGYNVSNFVPILEGSPVAYYLNTNCYEMLYITAGGFYLSHSNTAADGNWNKRNQTYYYIAFH